MNWVGCLALWCGLTTTAALAAPKGETYECHVRDTRSQGYWLPDFLFLGYDRSQDLVIVSDQLILHFNQSQPVKGRVATENAKRITIAWTLQVDAPGLDFATIAYRGTYHKSTGVFSISASPLGFENRYVGQGRCEVKHLN